MGRTSFDWQFSTSTSVPCGSLRPDSASSVIHSFRYSQCMRPSIVRSLAACAGRHSGRSSGGHGWDGGDGSIAGVRPTRPKRLAAAAIASSLDAGSLDSSPATARPIGSSEGVGGGRRSTPTSAEAAASTNRGTATDLAIEIDSAVLTSRLARGTNLPSTWQPKGSSAAPSNSPEIVNGPPPPRASRCHPSPNFLTSGAVAPEASRTDQTPSRCSTDTPSRTTG